MAAEEPNGKRRRRDATARREALLEAARRRFARDRYEAVSVRDVAADVGVNVALVYRYFGSDRGRPRPPAPALVLYGSRTRPFQPAGARYVAAHIPHARVREIPGAGHAAPLTHPETLAKTLTELFGAR